MKAVALWDYNKLSKYSFSLLKVKGFVLFTQLEKDVKVSIFIEGLPDGKHGIHIHEKGVSEVINFEDIDCCDKLGGHFNISESWGLTEPNGTKHGNHTGDLCLNINSIDGVASYTYIDEKISLREEDENCVLNRSVVIHEDEDDLGKGFYADEDKNVESLISGNSGKRICCAEIRLIKDKNF